MTKERKVDDSELEDIAGGTNVIQRIGPGDTGPGDSGTGFEGSGGSDDSGGSGTGGSGGGGTPLDPENPNQGVG